MGNYSGKKIELKKVRANILGRGSFGVVYIGKLDGKVVAVKVINTHQNQKYWDKLKNETITFDKSLKHHNIIQILHYEDKSPEMPEIWIAMELCNESLYNFLENHSLDDSLVQNILWQCSKGVMYLHENHLVHRDIKPDNILIKLQDDSICVKVTDFSLSKDIESLLDSEITSIHGNKHWLAPEMFDDDGRRAAKIRFKGSTLQKIDVFSFGLIILYTCINKKGREDIWEKYELGLDVKRGKDVLEYFESLWENDSVKLFILPLLKKMLHVNSSDRPTMQEVCDFLRPKLDLGVSIWDCDVVKKFDVFVSYSGGESEWVMKVINDLEEEGFCVCDIDRDYERVNFKDTFQAVLQSKRTLCFVSRAFMESTYCIRSFHYSQALQADASYKNGPTVIMCEDIPDTELNEDIKTHMYYYNYLKKDSSEFMEKLMYSLKHGNAVNTQSSPKLRLTRNLMNKLSSGRDECEGEDKWFDVFLAHSGFDIDWTKTILRYLESEGFNVFVRARDEIIGGNQFPNIERAVRHSKRTLCLISKPYMVKKQCMFEFNMARVDDVVNNRRHLITALCEDIADEDMHEDVRTYINKFSSLKRGEKNFMSKLISRLGKIKVAKRVFTAQEREEAWCIQMMVDN